MIINKLYMDYLIKQASDISNVVDAEELHMINIIATNVSIENQPSDDELNTFGKATKEFTAISIFGVNFGSQFNNVYKMFDGNDTVECIMFVQCSFNHPDCGLTVIKLLSHLTHLQFIKCEFNETCFGWIIKDCQRLEQIEFKDCNTKHVEAYEYLCDNCPNIRHIINNEYPKIGVDEFEGYI